MPLLTGCGERQGHAKAPSESREKSGPRAHARTRAVRERRLTEAASASNAYRIPDDATMETYRIEVGHVHGVQPGNIVGAIANEAGIDGKHIGRIEIRDDHSFVDLPAGMPKELLGELRKARVAGQKLEISRALKTHAHKLRHEHRTPRQQGQGAAATLSKSNADLGRCRCVPGRDQGNPVSRGRSSARPGDAGRESADAHPLLRLLRFMQVAAGLDVADKRIVELLHAQDLVITADIPLAAAAIEKGAHALNPRGELYTKDNIRERLSMRNFMDELRGSGVVTGGPAVLNQRDRQAFANSLDSFLAKAPAP